MVIVVTTTTEPNWTATSGPGIPRGPHFAYGLGVQKKYQVHAVSCLCYLIPIVVVAGIMSSFGPT